MFSWFKKKPPPEDWRLVKTIEAQIHWTNAEINKDETIYYYLFESDRNNRRVEVKEDGEYSKSMNYDKRHWMYLKVIYPWLNGKIDDNIPTYYQVFAVEKEKHIKALYRRILSK